MSTAALLLSVATIHLVAMASPGPNVLVVTQTAMSRSHRLALAVAVGVATGSLLLSTGAAVGLGLLFEQVGWVRHAIQFAGGAYLVYLGVITWRGAGDPPPEPQPAREGGRGGVWRYYRRGLLTNLTNPKAAVFFGSILAPVLDQAVSAWVVAAAVAIVVANALWWHCLLAVLFARPTVRRWYGRAKRVIDRVVGAGLALLGARLGLEPVLEG
jgi:threonine efflux protein